MALSKTGSKYIIVLALALITLSLARPAEAQVAPEADLSIQKFDFPSEQVAVGETLFYELAIANIGDDTATNSVVTDTLPSNTEFLFPITGNCDTAGQTVTCNLGDLEPDEQASVEFAVCPTAPGTTTNIATTRSDSPESNLANNSDTATTQVTRPAVGRCPSQAPPPTTPEPRPTPPNDPTPEQPPRPAPPNDPRPEAPRDNAPVANNDLCFPEGAVAIKGLDFSLACAGGQAVASEGDVPDGILTGVKTGASAENSEALAGSSGLCFTEGAVAIKKRDFSLACAGESGAQARTLSTS